MLKHKKMDASKKDDLKDTAKEETVDMTVKGKEAKKNQELDKAVGFIEVDKEDDKKPEKVEAEAEEDKDASRRKSEYKKSGGEIFDEAIKRVHARIVKERETERSASGPARASSVGKGKEKGRKENVNHGGKMAETEGKKLSKEDGEEEQKEVEKEASRKILGVEPPQDDDKEDLKGEKGEMIKEESSDKQEKEVPPVLKIK